MIKLFLIISSINILLLLACTKQSQQEQESTPLQKTKNFREKLADNLETQAKNSSNHKSISAKIVKDKLNNLEIYNINNLFSKEEISLLSDDDQAEYAKILRRRVCDSTESISLYIYEYMRENNLFDLCDPIWQERMLRIAAGYANNYGKGFDKIYELYDSFINENPDRATNVLSDYFNYLIASQDYKKADEVFEKIASKYLETSELNKIIYKKLAASKFSEPFSNYQKNVEQFIFNVDKTEPEYQKALSDLAQRIAIEELYPDYKYKPKNIKRDFFFKYIDDIVPVSSGGIAERRVNSAEDLVKIMFTEKELDKYIEAVSNAYDKLSLEYGEPLTN